MLQRMVVNLLDNVLKFTPSGGSVKIATVAGKEDILITLHASGIGISEKDLPHIFEKFYRCDFRRPAFVGINLFMSDFLINLENFIAYLSMTVDILKAQQQLGDFVPAVEVNSNFRNIGLSNFRSLFA
jgi:light-regulated signal transduction histidine kinase (bacteriophytochrome)